jgi:hypothetical protein
MTSTGLATAVLVVFTLAASGCGTCEEKPSPEPASSVPAPVGTLPPLVEHLPGVPHFERKPGKHILNHVGFRDGTAKAIEQVPKAKPEED